MDQNNSKLQAPSQPSNENSGTEELSIASSMSNLQLNELAYNTTETGCHGRNDNSNDVSIPDNWIPSTEIYNNNLDILHQIQVLVHEGVGGRIIPVGAIVCDRQTGIYFAGRKESGNPKHINFLLKYSFALKGFSRLELPSNVEFTCQLVKLDKSQAGNLLLATHSFDGHVRFFNYDVEEESCTFLKPNCGSCILTESLSSPNQICRCSNLVFIIIPQKDKSIIYSFDLRSLIWEWKCLPEECNLINSKFSVVAFEGKLYIFDDKLKKDYKVIHCYDPCSHQVFLHETKRDPIYDWPNNTNKFVLKMSENDSMYMLSSWSTSTEIWQLDFPQLTWHKIPLSLLSVISLLGFTSNLTSHFEIFACSENILYRLNIHQKVRKLQNICWEIIFNISRTRPLYSYSNDELHDFGIPKKFRLKVFDW